MNQTLDPTVFRAWTARHGHLPDDYFALDCETSGLDMMADRILQIGIVIVRKRKATLSRSFVIDWPKVLDPDDVNHLRTRIHKTRDAMNSRGKPYPWTLELLSDRGEPPEAVANKVSDLIGENPYCVGHYAWNFDFPRLSLFMKSFGFAFDTYEENLYDTCLLSRAALASRAIGPAEELRTYYTRLTDLRGTASCNLESCITRHNLKLAGVDPKIGHSSADYDAWAAHLIFEKHREILSAAN